MVLLLLDDLCLVQWLDCHLFIFNKESNVNPPYILSNKAAVVAASLKLNEQSKIQTTAATTQALALLAVAEALGGAWRREVEGKEGRGWVERGWN